MKDGPPTKPVANKEGIPNLGTGGVFYNPKAATMKPDVDVWQRATIHNGEVYGEKDHQENANDLQAYGGDQEEAANTRIPYASTLVQIKHRDAPELVEIPTSVPIDYKFVKYIDDPEYLS